MRFQQAIEAILLEIWVFLITVALWIEYKTACSFCQTNNEITQNDWQVMKKAYIPQEPCIQQFHKMSRFSCHTLNLCTIQSLKRQTKFLHMVHNTFLHTPL